MEIDVQLLKAKLKYHKRTYAEVAEAIGMTRDTFARRLQREDFSIKNVHGLMESVPLTMDEVEEIFFGKEKSAMLHHDRHEDSKGLSPDGGSVLNPRKCDC